MSTMPCCVRPWEPEVGDLVIARIGEECAPEKHLWTQDEACWKNETVRAALAEAFGGPLKFQHLPAIGHVVSIDPEWNEPDEDGNACDNRCHHYYVDDAEMGEPRGRWKKVSDHFAAAELRLVYRVKARAAYAAGGKGGDHG